jgi:cytochrome c-type biogenesis protein CcmH/NrfG
VLRESVELLEKVVTRFPGRVTAHFNLAQSYLATGDTARAIAHLWHYIPLADSTSAERARIKIGLLERR